MSKHTKPDPSTKDAQTAKDAAEFDRVTNHQPVAPTPEEPMAPTPEAPVALTPDAPVFSSLDELHAWYKAQKKALRAPARKLAHANADATASAELATVITAFLATHKAKRITVHATTSNVRCVVRLFRRNPAPSPTVPATQPELVAGPDPIGETAANVEQIPAMLS